jgi:putative FmdB family regulatory protein
MPLYRYRCETCGHNFSVLDSFDSPDQRECSECGAPQARRVPSRVGTQYKGKGFYTTNYGRRQSSDTPTEKKTSAESSSS